MTLKKTKKQKESRFLVINTIDYLRPPTAALHSYIAIKGDQHCDYFMHMSASISSGRPFGRLWLSCTDTPRSESLRVSPVKPSRATHRISSSTKKKQSTRTGLITIPTHHSQNGIKEYQHSAAQWPGCLCSTTIGFNKRKTNVKQNYSESERHENCVRKWRYEFSKCDDLSSYRERQETKWK